MTLLTSRDSGTAGATGTTSTSEAAGAGLQRVDGRGGGHRDGFHLALRLPDEQHEPGRQHGRDHGEPQHLPQVVVEQGQPHERDERPDHGPGGVHRPVEAEGLAQRVRRNGVGDERVPRRPTDALADPVHHPSDEDHRPDPRGRHHDLADGGEGVAGEDQGLAPDPVRPAAGDVRHQRRHPGRRTLDEPDDHGRSGERTGQEQREQRVDQLAGRVLHERDQGDDHQRSGHPRRPGHEAHPLSRFES